MNDDRQTVHALAFENLYFFLQQFFSILEPRRAIIPARHIQANCWQLQLVAEGPVRRLLITVPPRYGKSLCASIAFPAWILGRDPRLKLIIACYGQDLAANHARTFRRLIESPDYHRLFPRMKIRRNTEAEITTTLMGGRKAVSLGGPLTSPLTKSVLDDTCPV